MDTSLENLFPDDLQLAIRDHFGLQSLGAVLLKQLIIGPSPGPILPGHPAAELLHPNETARASAYGLAKRRTEYVTGRVCAKLAMAEFRVTQSDNPAPATLEIVNDSSGRPFVNFSIGPGPGNRRLFEISITHGGKYGAALATKGCCGIDLQEQKDTLVRVMEKYCSADEYRLLQDSRPEMEQKARLSLLWAAKEAAKKALSCWWMPGFLDLQLTALPLPHPGGCSVFPLTVRHAKAHRIPERVTVLATAFDQYGLAVCILQEARAYAGIAGS
jgi:4'-phosphopantetheinyl transferase EntD